VARLASARAGTAASEGMDRQDGLPAADYSNGEPQCAPLIWLSRFPKEAVQLLFAAVPRNRDGKPVLNPLGASRAQCDSTQRQPNALTAERSTLLAG